MMHRFILHLSLYTAALSSSHAQEMTDYDSLISKLAYEFETPGVAVAIMKNFEFKEFTYGYSNLAEKKPVTSKTVFNVASISKLVTAHAVMQLAEEKKIDPDKPLENYLTKWQFAASPYNPDMVTIRRVLNHSAGLSTEFGPGFSSADTLLSLPEILSGKSSKRRSLRILSKPGEGHAYSNLAYGLLQLLIEEVSGKTYEDYLQESLFDKLNMTESSFKDPLLLDKSFDLATPYDYRLNPLEQERFVAVAAAGLQTNLTDLEKFMLEETKNKNLLATSSMDQLHDTSLQDKYGLGHIFTRNENKFAFVGHTGLGMGWNASFQFVPHSGDGIIVLTNGDNGFYIHNTITCSWYYYLARSHCAECNVAPDKKLNKISLFLEIASEQGELKKQDFDKYYSLLEESRNNLKANNFKEFQDQLEELQSQLKNTIKNTMIQTNLNQAFESCYYWLRMPWFTK